MTNDQSAESEQNDASRRLLPWMLVLFVGSGCAALIYEIAWLQLLQLVLGLTTISLGVLLGTFMGGMCLGSLLLPRLISRSHHPLRVYALLELGIAIVGIGVLFLIPLVARVYTESVGRGMPGFLLRGGLAALCLLPPTILMGATLPAIARWVEATPRGVSWLGFFYGGNIAGAVFGCLLAGFYLLRVHDMAFATYVAAGINGTVALLAFLLASRAGHSAKMPRSMEPLKALTVRSQSVYVVIALSGMTALGAEVVWTRLVSLMLGGTVYTFSLILAVFLTGLGLGSTGGSFLARNARSPRALLGWCQWLIAAAAAWTALMISHSIPYWPINPEISTSPWFTFQIDLVRCLWAILPGAILWGASFPLALAAAAAPGQDAGRLVGGVYAANTVGAIVGAVGFAIFIVPAIGTQAAQQLLIVLALVSSVIAFAPLLRRRETSPVLRYALAPALALGLFLAWTVSPAPWGLIAHGRFMATYVSQLAPGITKEEDVPSVHGTGPDIFCTYMGEGLNGSVAVTKWRNGYRYFHSAGKVQASSDPADMRLQRLLGHISALAVKEPKDVLVVACGAGVTAGTFTLYPELNQLTICDIEPLVPQKVTPQFKEQNYDVVNHPKTKVVHDDGRHFIRTSREKYDVITSDPIDPWVKGCAALNTVEYYTWCREHLKPGGVVTLWIPLYESNPETFKSVLATFFKVFPNGIMWSNDREGEGYDAVLFGQVEPTVFNLDELQARLDRPEYARIKESLANAGFPTAIEMLATYAGQAQDLKSWMADAQINYDSNLRLQYLAGLSFNSFIGTTILDEILRSMRFPDNLFLGTAQSLEAMKQALRDQGRPLAATVRLDPALARTTPAVGGF